jgi:hypothetical protein
VDEFGRGLVCEDGEEGPGDGDGGGEVAFWGGECVGCCCAFKEEAGGRELVSVSGTEGGRETYRARKTKTFVQMPAGWSWALTPNASKAVRMTRTVVQPWYREKGRWTKSSSVMFLGE